MVIFVAKKTATAYLKTCTYLDYVMTWLCKDDFLISENNKHFKKKSRVTVTVKKGKTFTVPYNFTLGESATRVVKIK